MTFLPHGNSERNDFTYSQMLPLTTLPYQSACFVLNQGLPLQLSVKQLSTSTSSTYIKACNTTLITLLFSFSSLIFLITAWQLDYVGHSAGVQWNNGSNYENKNQTQLTRFNCSTIKSFSNCFIHFLAFVTVNLIPVIFHLFSEPLKWIYTVKAVYTPIPCLGFAVFLELMLSNSFCFSTLAVTESMNIFYCKACPLALCQCSIRPLQEIFHSFLPDSKYK